MIKNDTNRNEASKGNNMNKREFIARGRINNNLIKCTDGEFHAPSQVGPGGWNVKVWGTKAGAARNGVAQELIDGIPAGE